MVLARERARPVPRPAVARPAVAYRGRRALVLVRKSREGRNRPIARRNRALVVAPGGNAICRVFPIFPMQPVGQDRLLV